MKEVLLNNPIKMVISQEMDRQEHLKKTAILFAFSYKAYAYCCQTVTSIAFNNAMHKIIHKNVRLYTYKWQLLPNFELNDKPSQKELAVNMMEQIYENKVCYQSLF